MLCDKKSPKFSTIVAVLLLLLCLPASAEDSPLSKIRLEKGMDRTAVEIQVAEALDRSNSYSAYGNNLTGGKVEYTDGKTVLVVEYNPGSPAPTILTRDGKRQSYPPMDETIKSFKFRPAD
jgi:hypothetical protein